MKKIRVAHSPDADDIFMFYAIKFGWISGDYKFVNIAKDIETLNQESLAGVYDVSAISFALYPHIANDYALLRTAISFGDGYGPKLIKLKGKRLKRNFKVALSGKYTTNALIFRLKYPDARIKYYNFLEIEKAVLSGEVDAGVLIHESILNFDERLEVEAEIWDIWSELSGGELPLPLGGMVIRRSIPLLDAINIEEILIRAVEVATSHKNLLSKMLLDRNLVRVDDATLKKYLSLYANEKSVKLDEIQIEAINKLFELGVKGGFYPEMIDVRDCLIPTEYKKLRNS